MVDSITNHSQHEPLLANLKLPKKTKIGVAEGNLSPGFGTGTKM